MSKARGNNGWMRREEKRGSGNKEARGGGLEERKRILARHSPRPDCGRQQRTNAQALSNQGVRALALVEGAINAVQSGIKRDAVLQRRRENRSRVREGQTLK